MNARCTFLSATNLATLLAGALAANAQGVPGATNTIPTTITLSATDAQASETGPNPGVFTVFRFGPTNGALTVFFAVGGTASASDYQPSFLSNGPAATFPAGASQIRLTVEPVDDSLAEGPETVLLRVVQPPPNVFLPAGNVYRIGSPSNAVVTIEDNDGGPPVQPVVNIVAVDAQGSEIPVVPPGLGMPQRIDSALFRITRSGETNFALPVYYGVAGTASNGVDYQRIPGQITIPIGAHSADLEIDVIDDLLIEGTESVFITLETPACPAIFPPPRECYVVGPDLRAIAAILDDETGQPTNRPPVVRITAPVNGTSFRAPADIRIEAETVDPDGYASTVEFFANSLKIGEASLVFIQAPPPGQPLYFDFTWANVPAGLYNLTARTRDDGGATAGSAPATILVGTNNTPNPTNNALPVVNIVARDAFASEGTNFFGTNNPAVFVISRSGPTNTALTVAYEIGGTAANGVDYASIPNTATIPAGRRTTRVVIQPLDDPLAEPIETVILSLRPNAPAGAVLPYVVGSPARAAATISDDDRGRPPCLRLPDHLFHFCLPRTNGFGHRIEVANNLLNWQVICTNVVVDGAVHFVDPDAPGEPNRFFRVSPAPVPPED